MNLIRATTHTYIYIYIQVCESETVRYEVDQRVMLGKVYYNIQVNTYVYVCMHVWILLCWIEFTTTSVYT
jgi:hypothetical protein